MKIQISFWLLVLFIIPNLATVSVDVLENLSAHPDETYTIGNRFIKGEGEERLTGLIGFIQSMGLDISYGEDGETIFSMVDTSLTKIISDLASGNAEGVFEVPLIQETFNHLGLNVDDIVVNPDNVSSSFEAIDRYNRRNQSTQNNSG